MAGRPIDTSVSVQLGDVRNAGASQLQMEAHSAFYLPYPDRLSAKAIRLYPYGAPRPDLATTIGKVTYHSKGQREEQEFVTVNGGDVINTQYPVTKIKEIKTVFLFDPATKETEKFVSSSGGVQGSSFSPDGSNRLSFTIDEATGQISLSRTVYGVFEVEYETSFYILRYEPGETLLKGVGGRVKGKRLDYGKVAAFKEGSLVLYDVPGREFADESRWKELYRVTSDVIVNEYGAWEEHPSWPDQTWPDANAPTQNQTHLTNQRVHEVGYINPSITEVRVNRFTFRREQGADPTFQPYVDVRFAADTEFLGTEWWSSYASINTDEIVVDLRNRYRVNSVENQ